MSTEIRLIGGGVAVTDEPYEKLVKRQENCRADGVDYEIEIAAGSTGTSRMLVNPAGVASIRDLDGATREGAILDALGRDPATVEQ